MRPNGSDRNSRSVLRRYFLISFRGTVPGRYRRACRPPIGTGSPASVRYQYGKIAGIGDPAI